MTSKHTLGWIGMGRMGYPMAERLLKAGNTVSIWNRTRSKAEPLAKLGGRVVETPADLAGCDLVFVMVSTGKDLDEVCFGKGGVAAGGKGKAPKVIVDCSSISVQESADCRAKLAGAGRGFPRGAGERQRQGGEGRQALARSSSGSKAAFETAKPYMLSFAPRGVSYVGEGERSRICKIAHNVMLGVVIQNLAEITILAEKAGVPRHAFLEFMNNGAMGSMFTRYKSNAFVNLDWTTTFTPELLRKDLDLGLEAGRKLGVPMPVTAATREALQAHFGAATLQADPQAYLAKDFAATLETVALAAGIKLKSENVPVPTGLETEE